MGWELARGVVEVGCGTGGFGPGPGMVEWAAGVGPVVVWAAGFGLVVRVVW
jgi:hypothetical protein